MGIFVGEGHHAEFFDPPFTVFLALGMSGFLIRSEIFVEGKAEVWAGLHQVVAAHLSPEVTIHIL